MAEEVQPPEGLLPPAELIQTVALKMCSEKGVFHGSTAPCQWCLHDAANALAALEAADFVLLPPGGEVSTQYGVRWHATPGYGDEWDDWGFSDEAHAREEMASSPTPSTLLRLRAITLPVEPVVSDTSEAPDG